MTDPREAVTKQLWEAFVEATYHDPRGLFFRIGDEGAKMRCLMIVLGEVFAPLVLEVQDLRERVRKLEAQRP